MLLLALLCTRAALAETPAPPEAEAPATPTQTEPGTGPDTASAGARFVAELKEAKELYFEGQHVQALEALRALQVQLLEGSVEPEWEHAAEAMVFVGEVNLELGRVDAARTAFRWVLEKDPDYAVSPYHHPSHVRAEFFEVQSEVKAELASQVVPPPTTVARTPLPVWGYLPLGIPQFAEKRPLTGLGHLALQTALGAGSILTYRRLQAINPGRRETDHPLGWTEEETRVRVQQTRYLVQWPLTVGFYGAWLASTLDARRAWRHPTPRDPVASSPARELRVEVVVLRAEI